MRSALTIILIFVFSLGLWAQSRPVSYNPPAGPARDLNSSLDELMRVAPATNQDLTGLPQPGKFTWIMFWRRDTAHSAEVSAAVRRNLESAVPNLVHEAQASGGTIASTFKLYNDLSVVCESLNTLVSAGSRTGKPEYRALSNDLSDLNRIREDLSAYIQQTAASLESAHPELASSAGRPKKIIIDDNIPEKPKTKRHRSSHQ